MASLFQPRPRLSKVIAVANGLPRSEVLSQIPGIESGELALDLILHDLAEGVRQNTQATGAAIALERGGALVCRAAAGSTVPDLGAQINIQSGLSGACVREKKLQWCSDTEMDSRVDAAAARMLGVRSILVSPLVVGDGIIGVLELFSSQAGAFRDREVAIMQETGQAIIASLRKAGLYHEAATQRSVPQPRPARSPSQVAGFQRSFLALQKRDRTTRVLRAIAVSLAVLLCFLLGLRWTGARTKSAAAQQATSAPQADVAESSATVPGGGAQELAPSKPKPASGRVRAASRTGSVIRHDNNGLTITQADNADAKNDTDVESVSNSASRTSAQPRSADPEVKTRAEVEPSPDKLVAEIGSAPMRALPSGLNAVVAPPAITVPPPNVSQGLQEGHLLHSVQPKYPREAVNRHIEGMVVLHAVIGKDGSMRQVKSMRGDPLLAQAALEAVRQWRYQPYKLDGNPVDMAIDITINFNLPK